MLGFSGDTDDLCDNVASNNDDNDDNLCTAGMASLLMPEDEPEDVKPIEYTVLSTAVTRDHPVSTQDHPPSTQDHTVSTQDHLLSTQDHTAGSADRSRRRSTGDAAVDSRRWRTLLPGTL